MKNNTRRRIDLFQIEIAAKLHHPHILPLHDSGEAEGFLYYVMPCVEGESLRDRLNREKRLPVELISRLRAKDWTGFATGYNGPGQAKRYGRLISTAYDEGTRLFSA